MHPSMYHHLLVLRHDFESPQGSNFGIGRSSAVHDLVRLEGRGAPECHFGRGRARFAVAPEGGVEHQHIAIVVVGVGIGAAAGLAHGHSFHAFHFLQALESFLGERVVGKVHLDWLV